AEVERTLAELHGGTTASHVGPEGNAGRIGLPEAERRGAGADTVAVGTCSVPRNHVPRHHAVGDKSAPFEVAVAPLPGVTKEQTRPVQLPAPTESYAQDVNPRRGEGAGRRTPSAR